MKSKSIRVSTLSALVAASAAFTFAGSQSGQMRVPTKAEMQDRSGITRAVQQGKGTLITRNDRAFAASAYREQTTRDSAKLKDQVRTVPPSSGDPALRK